MPKLADPAAARVAIVSSNPETLDGLKTYLDRAGIAARSVRRLGEVLRVVPSNTTAAIVFPDDFEADAVFTLLQRLRQERPPILTLLVTRDPGRFRAAMAGQDETLSPIFLAKPPFGWEIVDLLRAHAQ